MSGHPHINTEETIAILTDVTKCVGCQKCVVACVEENQTGDPVPYIYSHPDGLSGSRWTSVLKIQDRFVRKQCVHCVDPSCQSACLVGALKKQPNGAVTYDAKKCIGCRYCMISCPFTIPRYQWDTWMPFVRKCILCSGKTNHPEAEGRLQEGKQPACTGACPYGATISGTRKEMLEEAARRLKESPDKYIPRIWGEHDYGGTNVLYISDVPLEELGFPKSRDTKWEKISIPSANMPVVMATPFIFVSVMGGSVSWILSRRMKLAAERKKLKESEQSGERE